MSQSKTYLSRLRSGLHKRVAAGNKRLRNIRWRPVTLVTVVGVAVLAAGLGGIWAYRAQNGLSNPVEAVRAAAVALTQRSAAALAEDVKANPLDGKLLVDLGDAQFFEGKRGPAHHSYDRAMELKAEPSEAMIKNLTSSLGSKNHDASMAILVKHKLVVAADALHAVTSHPEHKVRWAAIDLLSKLKVAQHSDYVRAWTRDLNEPACDVRKNAVVNLGRFGSRRTLAAIRSADMKDEKETPWYGITCLGNRPEDAEQQILAKK